MWLVGHERLRHRRLGAVGWAARRKLEAAPSFGHIKAKHARPKDQADFDGTVPHLTADRRARLAGLLARVYPEHRWLAGLTPERQE